MTKQRSIVASMGPGLLGGIVLYALIVLLGWNGPTSNSPGLLSLGRSPPLSPQSCLA